LTTIKESFMLKITKRIKVLKSEGDGAMFLLPVKWREKISHYSTHLFVGTFMLTSFVIIVLWFLGYKAY
jgi:hypothetical protein